MKAILEFDAPKNCACCPLLYMGSDSNYQVICYARQVVRPIGDRSLKKALLIVSPNRGRNTICPLKIVSPGKETTGEEI
jgi:hypothetical protein